VLLCIQFKNTRISIPRETEQDDASFAILKIHIIMEETPGSIKNADLRLILSTNYTPSCLDVENYFDCQAYNTVNLYCIFKKRELFFNYSYNGRGILL
jgi:hypothetical protein